MITLEPRYLDRVTTILSREIGTTPAQVYLFGSRVGNKVRPASDIDLAVSAVKNEIGLVSRLREAFEESTIPYSTDVISLSTANKAFCSTVQKEGVLIWKS